MVQEEIIADNLLLWARSLISVLMVVKGKGEVYFEPEARITLG